MITSYGNRLFLAALVVSQLSAPALHAADLDLRTDVIQSAVPQEVEFVEHDLAPGSGSGWHIHHGVELTYLARGELMLTIAGQPARLLHAGDSFMVPRDTPHEAQNVGSSEAAMIISYLMDKGVPGKIPVPAPASH